MESEAPPAAPAESQPDAPSTHRLVIRVKLTSEEEQPIPARQGPSRGVLLLGAGAVLALVIGVAVYLFTKDPDPPAQVSARTSAGEAAVATRGDRAPAPAAAAAVAPPSVQTKEVLPNVARSARATIRGTIRVAIRVIVGADGSVVAATADEPGPSRYFERVALEAAKQWTFPPLDAAVHAPRDAARDAQQQRIVIVKFGFTRGGTTAQAKPLAGD